MPVERQSADIKEFGLLPLRRFRGESVIREQVIFFSDAIKKREHIFAVDGRQLRGNRTADGDVGIGYFEPGQSRPFDRMQGKVHPGDELEVQMKHPPRQISDVYTMLIGTDDGIDPMLLDIFGDSEEIPIVKKKARNRGVKFRDRQALFPSEAPGSFVREIQDQQRGVLVERRVEALE